MSSKVRLGLKIYLVAISRSIASVDHWTLGGIAHPLEKRCLPCIRSSNNENSELDVAGDLGEKLQRIHGTKACKVEDRSGGVRLPEL